MSADLAPFGELRRFLRRVRRRLLWVHVGAGLALTLATMAGVWLLSALVAAALGPHALWPLAVGVAVALGALLTLGMGLLRPWLGLRRETDVAVQVGELAPTLRSDLLSSVELGTELRDAGEAVPFSRPLALALAERTCRAAEALPLHQVAPGRPLWRSLGLLALVALAYGLCALVSPGLLARGALALSRRGALVANRANEPIVGELTVTLTYPPYTGLPPRTFTNTSGDVSALPGTKVRVETRPLLPTRRATCLFGEEDARPAEVDGSRIAISFTVEKPSSYRFVLEPPASRPVAEPLAHQIAVEVDQAPRIEALVASDELDVSHRKIVEVGYRAEDDHGLGEIALVYQVDSGKEQRRLLAAKLDTRSAQGRLDWEIAELGLRPGARVAYRIEARDNDRISGPHVGRSKTFHLRFPSGKERRALEIERQLELLDRLIAVLGDRLTPGREEAVPLLESIEATHARQEEASLIAGQLAEAAREDASAPRALRPALLGISERLGKLLRDEARLLAEARNEEEQRSTVRPETTGRLRQEGQRHVPEPERSVLALDDLIARQRLEDLSTLGREAAQVRDRLKQLLAQYKKSRDPKLRADLERQIREMAARMREMAKKLAELHARKEVPDEFLNARVGKDALSALDRLASMVERGDLEGAERALSELSQTLDSLQAALGDDLKGLRESRFSAEEKAMSELRDKIGDLEAQEQELAQETEKVMKARREQTSEQMKAKLEELAKAELEKVEELERRTADVPGAPLPPYDQEELDKAKRRIADLKKMLGEHDLEQALDMARQAQSSLKTVEEGARQEAARLSPGRRIRQDVADAQAKLEQTTPLAREIVEDLERSLPSPQDLDEEQRKRMGSLAEQQQRIRQRAERLAQEMMRRGKETPGLGEATPGLQAAGREMQRAERTLREGKPRDAHAQEQQAQQKLSELRKSLEQRQQAGGGAGMRELDEERVKIPGADEFRAPKEFRQDILDAMKEADKAPEPYRGQVKRYYRELVQ